MKKRTMKMNGNWEYQMQILNKRKKVIEISQTIDKVLFEWYSERGKQVPNWKSSKDPSWWTDYLNELKENEL